MRSRDLACVALLAGAPLVACSDAPTAPDDRAADVAAAVRTGEKLSRVTIRVPGRTTSSSSTPTIALGVGQSVQLSSMLYYSRGGTLRGEPYVQWGSYDGCVATVTNKSPSWGRVKGIKAGTVLVVAEFGGKADSVFIKVTGSGNADPSCEDRRDAASRDDESNGTPSKSYGVKRGEKLKKVVLFKPKVSVKPGQSHKLAAELWYSGGGKLNGVPYVTFSSMDTRVATVSRSTGVMAGVRPGTVRMVVRLGPMSDTVSVTIR